MKLHMVVDVDLGENQGSFQACEQKAHDAMLNFGVELMKQILLSHEQQELKKKKYLIKDKRQKTYQTLSGEVCLERYRVFDRKTKRHVYLIDEWLGLKPHQQISGGLKHKIVEACVQRPYRQATKEITQWTGIKRNPLSNWKMVQAESAKVLWQDSERGMRPYSWKRKPIPERDPSKPDPCEVLCIDLDGTFCKTQKKRFPKHDIKQAVLYRYKQRIGNSKKHRLVDKQIVLSKTSETLDQFLDRVTEKAIAHYGAHRDTLVVIHGDGGVWIRNFKINYFHKTLYRLDPWHVKKKMREALGTIEVPKAWEELIYGKPDELVSTLGLFMVQHTKPRSQEREKMQELIEYLKNNREGLLPSNIPPEMKEKHPRVFLRGSGQMESNICSAVCSRFKLRKMSWSGRGLDHLAALRERHLNGYQQPKYKVPEPLTNIRIDLGSLGSLNLPSK